MVKYYGRAKQRTGSVNTNQLGLKMSGCPSRVGRRGILGSYINQRVSCARGICATPLVHMVAWHRTYKNRPPFCVAPANKCLASAGGIGNINTPYYKTIQPGKQGCGLFPYEVLEIKGGVGGLDKCAKWKTDKHVDDGFQETNWYGSTAAFNCAGGFFGNSGSLVPIQPQGPQTLLFGTALLNNPIAVTNVQFGVPQNMLVPPRLPAGAPTVAPAGTIFCNLWFDVALSSPDIRIAKATFILTTSTGQYTFNLITGVANPPGTCGSSPPLCLNPPNNLIQSKIPVPLNQPAADLFNALVAGYTAGEIMDLCVKDVVLTVQGN